MIPENVLALPVAAELNTKFPDALIEGKNDLGELTLVVDPARIIELSRYLKTDAKFIRLSGVTANDWFPAEPRFEVVYHYHRFDPEYRLRLKCRVSGEAPEIDSLTPVYKGANWYEREIFDMFGITFRNHPDPTRILMPDDWEGHPLRKDYPIHGFKYSYQSE